VRVESQSTEKTGLAARSLHLLYHEVRTSESAYSYVIEGQEFARHIEVIGSMQHDDVPGVRPEVTFDDGHISNLECALPVLKAHNVTARFFITVGWTGKKPGFMSWEQLRSLQAAGQQMGAHGWSHTLLTHCSKAELEQELNVARLTLEDKLGIPIETMSLPGGRCNPAVLKACREAGYSTVYTSTPQAEKVPLGFTVGRLNIRGDMTSEQLRRLLEPGSKSLASLERQHRVKAAAKRLLGDRMYERVWAALNKKEAVNEQGTAE